MVTSQPWESTLDWSQDRDWRSHIPICVWVDAAAAADHHLKGSPSAAPLRLCWPCPLWALLFRQRWGKDLDDDGGDDEDFALSHSLQIIIIILILNACIGSSFCARSARAAAAAYLKAIKEGVVVRRRVSWCYSLTHSLTADNLSKMCTSDVMWTTTDTSFGRCCQRLPAVIQWDSRFYFDD